MSTCIDRSDILGPLGEGSFGKVYKIKRDGSHYALKVFDHDALIGGALTEVDVLLRVKHPNIISVVEGYTKYFNDECEVCLVMELGDMDLASYMKTRLVENEKILIMYQLLCAVRYLHNNYIIHRDIKPNNILMVGSTPKLADFGLAVTSGKTSKPLTTLFAAPLYRAPEILLASFVHKKDWASAISYSAVVDEWALGCVFYELITGVETVEGKDEEELIEDIYTKIGPIPEELVKAARAKFVTSGYSPEAKRRFFGVIKNSAIRDLIEGLLGPNPKTRMTVAEALRSPAFNVLPPLSLECKSDVIENRPEVLVLSKEYLLARSRALQELLEEIEGNTGAFFLAVDMVDRYYSSSIGAPSSLDIKVVAIACYEIACALLEEGSEAYNIHYPASTPHQRCKVLDRLHFKLFRPTIEIGSTSNPLTLAQCYVDHPVPDEIRKCVGATNAEEQNIYFTSRYLIKNVRAAKDKKNSIDKLLRWMLANRVSFGMLERIYTKMDPDRFATEGRRPDDGPKLVDTVRVIIDVHGDSKIRKKMVAVSAAAP